MTKKYRILVTRPDGTKVYQPVVYTSRKRAREMAEKWNEAVPDYIHEVVEA